MSDESDFDFDLPDCNEEATVNSTYTPALPALKPSAPAVGCDEPECPEDEGLVNDSFSVNSFAKPQMTLAFKSASLTTDYSQMLSEFSKTFSHESFTTKSKQRLQTSIGAETDYIAKNLEKVRATLFGEDLSVVGVTKNSHKLDVQGRFYDKASKTKEKIDRLRVEQQHKESRQCSFKPATNEKAGTFNDFMQRFESRTKRELRYPSEEALVNMPVINEKSAKIAASKRDGTPVHLRLFQQARELVKKHKQTVARHSTSPISRANASTSPAPRDTSIVYDELYKEAMAWHARRDSVPEPAAKPLEKFLSSNSAKLLRQKFQEEVARAFESAGVKEESLTVGEAEQVLNAMKLMGLPKSIEECKVFLKLWVMLDGDVHVSSNKLREFLSTLEGNSVEGSPVKCRALQKEFRSMLDRRRAEQLRERSTPVKQSPFKPELNELSVQLTRRRHLSQPDIAIHETLHRDASVRKARREQLVEEGKSETVYSFKPSVSLSSLNIIGTVDHKDGSLANEYRQLSKSISNISERLYSYAPKQRAFRDEKSKEAQELERSKSVLGCTFSPSPDKQRAAVNEKEVVERLSKSKEFSRKDLLRMEAHNRHKSAIMIVGIEHRSRYETIADRTKPVLTPIKQLAKKHDQKEPDADVPEPDDSRDVDSSFEALSSISKSSLLGVKELA
jgi:hypothetical protein